MPASTVSSSTAPGCRRGSATTDTALRAKCFTALTPPPAARVLNADLPRSGRCVPRSPGRKCAMRPWIGQAAASPSAQIVWPSISRRDFEQHVDLALLRAAFRHAGTDAPHPARALAAGRALAAALVLVEIADAGDRADDIRRLVHDDHGGRAEARTAASRSVSKSIGASMICVRGHQRHRRAAGDHGLQIVQAAAHAAAMLLDQLAEGDAHLLFDIARLVHMAGDAKQLRARVVRARRS